MENTQMSWAGNKTSIRNAIHFSPVHTTTAHFDVLISILYNLNRYVSRLCSCLEKRGAYTYNTRRCAQTNAFMNLPTDAENACVCVHHI